MNRAKNNWLSMLFIKFYDSKYFEFCSFSFIFPALIYIPLYFFEFRFLSETNVISFFDKFATTFLGSSASIFGISLAALFVFISVIYKPAIPKMEEFNLLQIFLFPFFINIVLWGLVASLSIFAMYINLFSIIEIIITKYNIFITFYTYLLTVAFLYTIKLAKHVIETTIISFQGK